MKYKAECTHILSQLLNIKKYDYHKITEIDGRHYIEVYDKLEYLYIKEMELNMARALWWYRELIETTSK